MSASPLALVTGGAHRLGKSFALTLARLGFDIILHYHSALDEALQTQVEIESLKRRVTLAPADLTQPSEIHALLSAFHSLDVLVNSAAFMPSGNVDSLSLETWNTTLDLNLRAPFLLAQECAKKMNAGGLIVNITDVGAQKAWSRYPSYTVSKAALESLTRILARALAPKIRVNAIAPAQVATATFKRNMLGDPRFNATLRLRLMAGIPLNRFLEPEEFVGPAVFLCSAAASAVTGVILPVDGGNLALNAGGNHIWPTD